MANGAHYAVLRRKSLVSSHVELKPNDTLRA